MGLRVDGSAIEIQFIDENAKPVGAPITTPFVALRGDDRQKIVARGAPLTQSEALLPGSDDWLTVVAIADSRERLDKLVREVSAEFPTTALTSAGSRRVLVKVHVGEDDPRSVENALTIADGEVSPDDPQHMNVRSFKILSSETALVDPALKADFIRAAAHLIRLQNRAVTNQP